MSRNDRLRKGDAVGWNTSQGETSGTVIEIATRSVTIKGNMVKASAEEPAVVVKSKKTGAKAAHKPEAVHRK